MALGFGVGYCDLAGNDLNGRPFLRVGFKEKPEAFDFAWQLFVTGCKGVVVFPITDEKLDPEHIGWDYVKAHGYPSILPSKKT